jgi:cellulose synthase/poly-beta-1,6-N-acetylglucosamine synthase-like glycosyltransferase
MSSIVFIYAALFITTFTGLLFLITFFENMNKMGNPRIRKYPTVCIVIPAHNEEPSIASTIESAMAIDYPKNKIEIFVVENGESKDKTYAIAKKYRKYGIKVISLKRGGKGHAMNYVLKKTKSEIFITMDADTFADKDVLKKMLGYFNNPDVMAVAPTMKSKNNENLSQKIQNIEYLVGAFLRKVYHFLDSVYVTPGAFTAYRKSFFDKYGGFDTKHITEDIEMTLRIQAKRYKIANAIDASVYTITPKKMKTLFWQRVRWYLGYIESTIQYRKVLFSTKHGYLGTVIAPTAIASIVYMIYLFVILIEEAIKTAIDIFYASISGTNPVILLQQIKLTPFYFHVSIVSFVAVLAIIVSLLMFFIAKSYSSDKSDYKVGYLGFALLYIFLFAVWWISAIYYKIFGNELRFGGVVWRNSLVSNFKLAYNK